MRSFRGAAGVLVLLAFCVVSALPAAAAAKTEKAQFKLVIEGSTYAVRSFSLSGPVSLCNENISGEFKEQTEYLRGKGVVLDIVRHKVGKGYQYGAKRGGGKPDFTVVDTSSREATGSASLTPKPNLPEPLAAAAAQSCSQLNQDLSTTPGCKVKKTVHDDMGLKISGNTFAVVPAGDQIAAPLTKPTCGETIDTKGLLALSYEWPAVPDTKFAPFPDVKMFNPHINAIAVELSSGQIIGEPKPIGEPGALSGTETDSGANIATVRFIRCGEHKQPAC